MRAFVCLRRGLTCVLFVACGVYPQPSRVRSILDGAGMAMTDDMNAADVMLVNTCRLLTRLATGSLSAYAVVAVCSIRENAESKVFQRLDVFRNVKRKRKDAVVGVLGETSQPAHNKAPV